ncbi:hypothetical protein BOX15_Mlig003050g1, partial [Macrostomum lignano]
RLRQRAGAALAAARASEDTDRAAGAAPQAPLKIVCSTAASGAGGIVKRKQLASKCSALLKPKKLTGSARRAVKRQAVDILQRRRATQAGKQPLIESDAEDDNDNEDNNLDAKPSISDTGGVERALSVVAPPSGRALRTDLTAEALQSAMAAVDSQSVISGKTVKALGLRLNKQQRRRLKSQLLRQRVEAQQLQQKEAKSGSKADDAKNLLPQMDILDRLASPSDEAAARRRLLKLKKKKSKKLSAASTGGQLRQKQRKRLEAATADAQRLAGMRAGAQGLLFAASGCYSNPEMTKLPTEVSGAETVEQLNRIAGLL